MTDDRFIVTIPLRLTKEEDFQLTQKVKTSNKLYNFFLNDGLKRYNLYSQYVHVLYKKLDEMKLVSDKEKKKIRNKVLTDLKNNFFRSFVSKEVTYNDYKKYLHMTDKKEKAEFRKEVLGNGYFLDTPNFYYTNINVQKLIDDGDWMTDNSHVCYWPGCAMKNYENNSWQATSIKSIGSQVTKAMVNNILTNKLKMKIDDPKSIGILKHRRIRNIKAIGNSHNNSNLVFSVDNEGYGCITFTNMYLKTEQKLENMTNPRIVELYDILKDNKNICMCTLKHDIIRNDSRWFVDVCVKGVPKVTFEKIDDVCGLDLGPKNFAISDSTMAEYKSFHNLETKQKEIKFLNKQLSNKIPKDIKKSWNSKNKKDRKKYVQSKAYKKAMTKCKELDRKFKITSNIEINKLAKHIAGYKTVFTEDVSYKSWQQTYGKCMCIFKPAYFMNKLENDMNKMGNSLVKIDIRAALSQYCVCGHKEKKDLSERIHICSNCGLKIQRDILSSILAQHTDKDTLKIDFEAAKKHVDTLGNVVIINT